MSYCKCSFDAIMNIVRSIYADIGIYQSVFASSISKRIIGIFELIF